MMIPLDIMDAALIVQSIESNDWDYCGEGERARAIVRRLREASQKFAREMAKEKR